MWLERICQVRTTEKTPLLSEPPNNDQSATPQYNTTPRPVNSVPVSIYAHTGSDITVSDFPRHNRPRDCSNGFVKDVEPSITLRELNGRTRDGSNASSVSNGLGL